MFWLQLPSYYSGLNSAVRTCLCVASPVMMFWNCFCLAGNWRRQQPERWIRDSVATMCKLIFFTNSKMLFSYLKLQSRFMETGQRWSCLHVSLWEWSALWPIVAGVCPCVRGGVHPTLLNIFSANMGANVAYLSAEINVIHALSWWIF